MVTDTSVEQNLSLTASSVRIDASFPQAQLVETAVSSVINRKPFDVRIAFSEGVIVFTTTDLKVTGGVVNSLTPLDAASKLYAASITPTADGTLSVRIFSEQLPISVAIPNFGSK